jgi:hypothetical protein
MQSGILLDGMSRVPSQNVSVMNANMKSDQKKTRRRPVLKVIYIGEKFYGDTDSLMSSVYEATTRERLHWGMITHYLKEGGKVVIRPANKKEMAWAYRTLNRVQHNEAMRKFGK